MKTGILTILKKELARFFGDKRMAITTILLPGILIYVLYSFMGSALAEQFSADDATPPTVAAVHLPASIAPLLLDATQLSETEDLDAAKTAITAQALDALLVFPVEFDAQVAAYDVASGTPAPSIELYYNSASSNSDAARTLLITLLDSYESSITNKFDVNSDFDLISAADETGSVFSTMLPMLLMIFLFSGCMAVAPESIAGEKERGTIATLLITPIGRSEIALGKIAALSIIALLSGFSSATGTILSLPKLMGSAADISGSAYALQDYLLLGAVILSTVLVLVTLISVVSAFAKTIKEAQTMVMPLMILVMFLGITAMFGNGAHAETGYYFIPLYNSVQCMTGVLSFDISSLHILITVGSNILCAAVGVWILTKMFRSERIIFSK